MKGPKSTRLDAMHRRYRDDEQIVNQIGDQIRMVPSMQEY